MAFLPPNIAAVAYQRLFWLCRKQPEPHTVAQRDKEQ